MNKKLLISMLTLALLAGSAFAQKPKAYLVSTAHFDSQWNWDVTESIGDYLHRTMVQNFWLIEHFPDYTFNFESAQKYAWMKEYYPQEYEKVKAYIKAGRWNVSGSAWEATDPNVPSSESFFRNMLLGQTFYKNEFGVKANDIYLPDCFGFGYTLPTIASHSGLIGFSTQKLQWRKSLYYGSNDKVPFKIGLWQGIDGSRIMAVCDAGGYGTSYYYEDVSTNKRIIDRAALGPNNVAYSYYGVGDRGGSPTLPSVWSVVNSLKSGKGPLELVSARSGQLYEDYYPFENHPELDVFDGELTMDVHGVGTYTSHSEMKNFNRRNEVLIDAAERASVAAELLGGMDYPAGELRENWERFLWHQFHDDITGTSIPRSYTFSWNDELIAQSKSAELIADAVGAVSRALNTDVSGEPLVVYNPLAVARKDMVTAKIKMDKQPKGIAVTDMRGKSMPVQLLGWQDGEAEIIFVADVAPLSFNVYNVKSGSAAGKGTFKVTDNSIENSVYKLTLDEKGDIVSLIDKREGRQLVAEGQTFGLQALTDNELQEYLAWEIYKKTVDGPSEAVKEDVSMSVVEKGPLRATIKVERKWRGSSFTQYVSLNSGAREDMVTVRNEVDWAGENVLMKVNFPMSVSNHRAAYDLGLGHIMRGNNTDQAFEVVGHRWADLTTDDGDYGISILNDSKYGWDKPSDNSLRLTLFHNPKAVNQFYNYQEHQDHGHHSFSYAIVGHKSTLADAAIPTVADCYNQPLLPFTTSKHKGELGRTFSLVECSTPQIVVKAIKKSEDGEMYVVRVNENYGKSYENARIKFAYPIESACEMNGIEEIKGDAAFDGNSIVFSGTAFQPRTFGVKFKNDKVLDKPENIFVELPYNAVAMTDDEFNKTGNFDRQGNSIAAELIPDTIVSEGVEFKMNNDPSIFDYVRSNGDTIMLPENHGADKLFLLVTSTKGDRRTQIKVDGKEYQVEIPYYSGFYGQWGWKGESEGYIKDSSIAFVGTHRHSERKGNDPYAFTYFYKVCLDITPDARMVVLPVDSAVALFAATLTDSRNYDTRPATEMRTLPTVTKPVEYVTEPEKPIRERGAW